jgi:hypothetical protein
MADVEIDSEPLDTEDVKTVRLGKAIARGMDELRPKRKSFGTYTREQAALNKKPRMTREYFQNGFPLDPKMSTVTAEAIDLLNRIVRPGMYHDRKVEVVFREAEGGKTSVDIVYANKTIDQRLGLHFSSFADIVRPIVEEQEGEDRADEIATGDGPEMTPMQARMAKARAARKRVDHA